MIKLFRIDERLIHGQIAIKWSRHTGVDSIVVANDHAAANVMIQKSLKMAAPPEESRQLLNQLMTQSRL